MIRIWEFRENGSIAMSWLMTPQELEEMMTYPRQPREYFIYEG